MDMWGVGCVLFEVLSLCPLFPGKNELDQINKIHNILGTPPKEILEQFKRYSKHMDFNFPKRDPTSISQLIPHVSREGHDCITKLLTYNPNDRPSAKQILNHAFFKELETPNNRIPSMVPNKEASRMEDDSGSEGSQGPEKRHGNNSLLGEKPLKIIPKKEMKIEKHNSSSDSEDLSIPNVDN